MYAKIYAEADCCMCCFAKTVCNGTAGDGLVSLRCQWILFSRHSIGAQLNSDETPLGFHEILGNHTQGSSFLATLGWRAKSRWDFKDGSCFGLVAAHDRNRNYVAPPWPNLT